MADEDQPQKDPGPIPPEPTVRTPPLPIGEQPGVDPGPLFSESVIKSETGHPRGLRIDKGDSGSE